MPKIDGQRIITLEDRGNQLASEKKREKRIYRDPGVDQDFNRSSLSTAREGRSEELFTKDPHEACFLNDLYETLSLRTFD